jgi:hypothetical protein
MKKICALLVLLLCTTLVMAQLRKVPAEVTAAFEAKYPSATSVSWKTM